MGNSIKLLTTTFDKKVQEYLKNLLIVTVLINLIMMKCHLINIFE